MRRQLGFTLIEVILIMIVLAIMANVIMLASITAARTTPSLLKDTIATQTARQCIEWYIGQRRLQLGDGYTTITCPSTTVPAFCTAPSGYTVSVNVVCTTINSDANYKTITVTVSGEASASLSTLIAEY